MPTEPKVAGTPTSGLTTEQKEIVNIREAMEKLEGAVKALEKEREAAGLELAKPYIQLPTAGSFDSASVLNQVNAWKTQDELKLRQIDAMKLLGEKLVLLYAKRVNDSQADGRAALTFLIKRMQGALERETTESQDLQRQIERLKLELDGLQKDPYAKGLTPHPEQKGTKDAR